MPGAGVAAATASEPADGQASFADSKGAADKIARLLTIICNMADITPVGIISTIHAICGRK
ncbi:MAG: hypothetical protein VX257_04525 [Planctomycetota bacterium]|nr:hypothetical protein [Planctomycetota bacterium]